MTVSSIIHKRGFSWLSGQFCLTFDHKPTSLTCLHVSSQVLQTLGGIYQKEERTDMDSSTDTLLTYQGFQMPTKA